jgi:hypothetical protein
MKPIAHVETEKLSDASKVFNVIVPANKSCDIRRGFKIGALDEQHAHAIAEALNNGVAWIDMGERA